MTQRHENTPNPQGKGLTPAVGYLVESSEGMRLPDVKDDSPSRIVEDYLSSLFVLSCDFRFRPVKNTVYYIYTHQGKIVLSLVSPEEGGTQIYDDSLGECFLKDDFSWSLTLEHGSEERFTFDDAFSDFKREHGLFSSDEERFGRLIQNILEERLGRRSRKLGYYQNVLNYILGKSVTLRSRRLLASEPQISERMQQLLPGLKRL